MLIRITARNPSSTHDIRSVALTEIELWHDDLSKSSLGYGLAAVFHIRPHLDEERSTAYARTFEL